MSEAKQHSTARSKKSKSLKKGYFRLLFRTLLFVLVIWLCFSQVLFLKRVTGSAKFPSLKDGDLTLGFRLDRNYQSGDIVLYTVDGTEHFGRVLTTAGNTVEMDGSGDVRVNGISESGEILFPSTDIGTLKYPYTVPEGTVFVMCDHRTETEDSRTYAAIPVRQIKGKVLSFLRRRGL